MSVSVVIPTSNAGQHFRRLLDVLKQQMLSFELIIIDSFSIDGTSEVILGLGVRLLTMKKEEFDHGGTRNLAASCANGDIIIFLTQDVLPVDELSLELLIRPFAEDDKIGACYGRQLPHPDASLFAAHLRFFNYPETSHVFALEDRRKHGIKTPFLSNSFAAYRKKALDEIGWFPDKLIMGEDTCAGARMLLAGYKIAYVAEAKVCHSHNYSAFHEFKRYFDIGVFHNEEKWLIEEFGRTEGEGKKFIQSGLKFIGNRRVYHIIPEFVFRTILKYVGYKLGMHYERLPAWIVKKLSMHQKYWGE